MKDLGNIKTWCMNPEDGALQQAHNLASLPFLFKHVALMPDTHQGYGMPIGGVIATKGVVIPNAVGVDIGCGMMFARTDLLVEDISVDRIKFLLGEIRRVVPVGFNHHKEQQVSSLNPMGVVCTQEYDKSLYSLGTLGGGNHFIELQKNKDGFLCVMVHSGSRNLGKQVADHYNKIADVLNRQWFSSVPAEHELAFLPADEVCGLRYIEEMNYCVQYAFENRKLMIDRIGAILKEHVDADYVQEINIAHNYASLENHFGHNVMVHRKGATRAYLGELGIIPGSQGTKSYIVEGKGNRDSFMSCSHGAGRAMGRKEAQRSLILDDEIKRLDDQGIIHGIRSVKDLDEACGAYKDISVVMSEQSDLVSILDELIPIAVIKG